ncbi:ATP-dependent DNA helicase RecG [Corynebacterium mendelii]|uniref:Probable DNA 3'-5' helicase RecG n=1 Tax=Corynebacterium mendelii TaxID=2765362 RepID=A0A939E2J1_9CORY|nr:ATP-dependent DNA helicase RecG [Corynebacterium mendelii]MBN9644598.1 ATP-dependent DNA helicase RecG [Corynebacterium mendelii]
MLGWSSSRRLAQIIPAAPAAAIAEALGGDTITDVLLHFPRDYHHGSGVDVEDARPGDVVTMTGTVTGARQTTTRRGQFMYTITLDSGRQKVNAIFFNSRYIARQLAPGTKAMVTGKLGFYRTTAQLSHPEFMVIPAPGKRGVMTGGMKKLAEFGSPGQLEALLTSLEYLPVYPTKKGTTSWMVLAAVDAVLKQLPPIDEPLGTTPEGFVSFDEAIRGIHQPDHRGPGVFADRIKYNEALSLALVLALARADNDRRTAPAAPPVAGQQSRAEKLLAGLPFEMTGGQKTVIGEISSDLSHTRPMARLLQGDVGTGKTLVALAGMLQVVDNGMQCALLAPTEVLATQHGATLSAQLERAGCAARVVVVTGSMKQKDKQQALLDIVTGQADIVVGTHALLQEGVEFFNLGLVVVDEQHRFGVEQRDRLRDSRDDGITPHLLVMTATPIPRTIAMTTFGDLSVSTLVELPGGRQPITSVVVPGHKPAWVSRTFERIREEVAQGSQAFVVCPTIDGPGGAEEMYHSLSAEIFPELSVGLVHGRLPGDDKEAVMADFAAGTIDILVATTVIEVGIDVPNATVMYIRDADRFGVSQLHQLRGRIGRGSKPSLCLMHTDQPEDSDSFARVTAVAATQDGFELAELDLRARREGDVLGTAQSGGRRRVRLLDLVDDGEIIRRAAADAAELVATNRQLAEQLVGDVAEEERDYIDKT